MKDYSKDLSEHPVEIECSKQADMMLMTVMSQGISPTYVTRKETLYFDETGNIKHLKVINGALNDSPEEVFVLGGVQAENEISAADLKKAMGHESDSELKARTILRGDFKEILKKENFTRILSLIQDKKWPIHFEIVQLLYYSFVDIIDSIEGLQSNPAEYKALLYEVLKRDVTRTVNHFKTNKYPNIKTDSISAFLGEIVQMIDDYIHTEEYPREWRPELEVLKKQVEKAKHQNKLLFIQNEETHTWVREFSQFYWQEIVSFPNKTLIFDEEKQVQAYLQREIIMMNGKRATNYRFEKSDENPMIQVCDFVVCILRKYVKFLDRSDKDVDGDITAFDEVQMNNFRLLNKILYQSFKNNPVFIHFIGSILVKDRFNKYMFSYGIEE